MKSLSSVMALIGVGISFKVVGPALTAKRLIRANRPWKVPDRKLLPFKYLFLKNLYSV
jgi:hypothetical protein